MVQMCQIVGYRDQLVTLLLLLAENVLNIILVHFQDGYALGTCFSFDLTFDACVAVVPDLLVTCLLTDLLHMIPIELRMY